MNSSSNINLELAHVRGRYAARWTLAQALERKATRRARQESRTIARIAKIADRYIGNGGA